jgi:hypothetical protein
VRAARQFQRPGGTAAAPDVLYISGAHLWLQAVDGGARRLVRAPWSMAIPNGSSFAPGVQWSPDSRRLALDDGRSRLAVVNLANGHVTMLLSRRCAKNCIGPTYQWSPNGRSLAILQPTPKGDVSILRVWDSSRGTTRRLLGGIPTYTGGLAWSRDSARLAVSTGKFDVIKSIFPSATIVDSNGHARTLGKGSSSSWSPDDRLLASIVSHTCGANTCDDDEVVRPSSGGPAITLISHILNIFEGPEWAPQPQGYAFDRWLLNASGHITRRLAGLRERVDSWERDGSHVAIQSYHPYESTPDALSISTRQGKRVHLYTDGPNQGCGACSKDVYRVTWSRGGQLVAFVTPEYPTPKMVTVYPMFFISSVDGGSLTRISIPGTDYSDILAFVDNDQALIIWSGKTIYRYDIPSRRLTVLATGIVPSAGIPAIDPATGY